MRYVYRLALLTGGSNVFAQPTAPKSDPRDG